MTERLQQEESNQRQAAALLGAGRLRDDFLLWQTLSTPGATLTAKEIERKRDAKEGLLVTYELYASGFPREAVYDLVTWPTGDLIPQTMLIGVSVDKDGRLYCAGKVKGQCKSDGDVPLRVTAFSRPGKPFRYALYNNLPRRSPSAIIATVVLIPEPIESHDGKCSVSVIRLMSLFEVAYLDANGFPPDSPIKLDGNAVTLGSEHAFKSDKNGHASWLVLPLTDGHTSGTAKVNVSGSSCSQTVEFSWGN